MYYRIFLSFFGAKSKQYLGNTYESSLVPRESMGSQKFARFNSTTFFVTDPEEDPILIIEIVAVGLNVIVVLYHFILYFFFKSSYGSLWNRES